MRIAFLKSRPIAVRRASLCALAAIAVLSFAAPARANVGESIINRCIHGQPLGGFSQSAYNQALKQLNSEQEEYSDCSSLIRQAELAAAGGGSSGGGPIAVPVTSTPAEQRSIARAAHSGAPPIQVGSQVIHPGVVHVNIASALSSLPTPLLATVAFLLACVIVVAAGALRNQIRARRPG
jgi:hypothetical protein